MLFTYLTNLQMFNLPCHKNTKVIINIDYTHLFWQWFVLFKEILYLIFFLYQRISVLVLLFRMRVKSDQLLVHEVRIYKKVPKHKLERAHWQFFDFEVNFWSSLCRCRVPNIDKGFDCFGGCQRNDFLATGSHHPSFYCKLPNVTMHQKNRGHLAHERSSIFLVTWRDPVGAFYVRTHIRWEQLL